MPNLATAETPFFLVYGINPNLPLHQLLEPIHQFLSDPDSRCLDLKSYHLAFPITKKMLDENHFKHTQKMMHHALANFKVGNRVSFQN